MKNKLELYVAKKLNTRPTKASGACKEMGDILDENFFIECKQKHRTPNFILTRREWLKLQNKMPTHTDKLPIWIIENRHNERVAIINLEDFFRINDILF